MTVEYIGINSVKQNTICGISFTAMRAINSNDNFKLK